MESQPGLFLVVRQSRFHALETAASRVLQPTQSSAVCHTERTKPTSVSSVGRIHRRLKRQRTKGTDRT